MRVVFEMVFWKSWSLEAVSPALHSFHCDICGTVYGIDPGSMLPYDFL